MRIFLIGYMGSGKSTFGKKLASRLRLNFIDLDEFIENKTGKSINEIFAENGEQHFREFEKECLSEVSLLPDTLISTGGGTPCFSDNMNLMNDAGVTIYLQISPKGLFSRLVHAKTKRPIIKDMTDDELMVFIEKHLSERETFYQLSKITINGLHLNSQTFNELENKINAYIR